MEPTADVLEKKYSFRLQTLLNFLQNSLDLFPFLTDPLVLIAFSILLCHLAKCKL